MNIKSLLFTVLLGFITAPVFAAPVKISQFTVSVTGGYQVSFSMKSKPNYQHFSLKNPDRFVLDFDNAVQNFTLSNSVFTGFPVKEMRIAKKKHQTLRLVFDLRVPSKITEKLSQQTGNYPYKLTLNFTLLKNNKAVIPLKTNSKSNPSAKKTKKLRKIVIVLDPGHGGRDPGATGPRGTHEKNITLAIGLDVRRDLQKIPGLTIDMTRTRDVYPTLSQRLYLARRVKADVFVSIHADAFHRRSARGATVFALSRGRATSEAARWIAERENKSELLGGVDLADKSYTLRSVLVDLSQTATIGSSLKLGKDVLANLRKFARLHSQRVEQASLYVLTSPDIPAILVETGFISNPTEERLLNNKQHQQKIARSIANGIKKYLIDNPIQDTVFTARMFGGKYIVKSGDSLSKIANKFRVSTAQLKQLNVIEKDNVFIGQVIRIPAKSK